MQLYTGISSDFVGDVDNNRITEMLRSEFVRQFAYEPGQPEVRSWQNSLRAMSTVLKTADLMDHGIVLEWRLPLTSKRLDVLVTGKAAGNRANAVIVELKQWDDVRSSPVNDCVQTYVGGGLRDVLHPSRQVAQYERYLLDVHTTFSSMDVGLQSCSYAHNIQRAMASELFDPKWDELTSRHPLFAGDDSSDLADYLGNAVGNGSGGDVLSEVLSGGYRPHKRLLEHTAAVIANEPAFVLLDEQQVAFETILARVRIRHLSQKRTVVIVHGGPGTGKSVIALNLVAALSLQGFTTNHATGSKAFTENLRKTVGPRAKALFNYFNSYTGPSPELDALICDEAHRIRENSNNRFMKAEARSVIPQIEELIGAAKVSVFLLDDLQVVRPGEIGSSDLIRAAAHAADADVNEITLEAQFRCSGSDSYLRWVDTTLGLVPSPNVLWDPADPFEFDVVDSVDELEAYVRSHAQAGETARLSAGYCWKWSKPLADGTLVNDVQVDGWSMPWNARPESGRLAAGIPSANYWASDPNGLDQVGCVYTAQGFEYDFAGVIWGLDLVYRPREGWVAQPEFSHDRVVRQAAKNGTFIDLVKNTYRVLLTRGLKGCAVHFMDERTRDFVLSRVGGQS